MEKQPACVFCEIVAGRLPAARLYEDELTLAFLDINPVNDGHALVIPKAHRASIFEMDPESLAAVARTTLILAKATNQALAPQGMNIFQANGTAAGQTVFHFHAHILPRNRGDRLRVEVHGKAAIEETRLQTLAARIRQEIGA